MKNAKCLIKYLGVIFQVFNSCVLRRTSCLSGILMLSNGTNNNYIKLVPPYLLWFGLDAHPSTVMILQAMRRGISASDFSCLSLRTRRLQSSAYIILEMQYFTNAIKWI